MRDSSLSVFIFVKARDALILCTQAVSFSCGRYTRIEKVWMSQPRQVLFFLSRPSPERLWSERGGISFQGFVVLPRSEYGVDYQ